MHALLESKTQESAAQNAAAKRLWDMDGTDVRIEHIRTNLKIAAAMRDLSLAEISRRADLGRNALSQFLTGKSILSVANLIAVCDVLDVPLALIYREDGLTRANLRIYRALEAMDGASLSSAIAKLSASVSEE